MATADVRVRLSAEGVKEIVDALRRIQAESGRTAQATRTITTSIGNFATSIKSLAAAAGALAIADKIRDAAAAGVSYNSEIESATLGMAALLTAQAKLVDASGRQLTGQEAYNAALGLSRSLMRDIQHDALLTAATTDQLAKAFQTGLSASLSAGITDLNQIRQLVLGITLAAQAMQVPMDQLTEEIRSLLAGNISQRNTIIATRLGITNEDIRRWKETGTLFQEISAKLKPFEIAAENAGKSFKVLESNADEALQRVSGAATTGLFASLKRGLSDVFSGLIDQSGAVTESLRPLLDLVNRIGAVVGDGIVAGINLVIRGAEALSGWLGKNKDQVDEITVSTAEVWRQIGGLLVDLVKVFASFVKVNAEAGGVTMKMKALAYTVALLRDGFMAISAIVMGLQAGILALQMPIVKLVEWTGTVMNTLQKGSGDALLQAAASYRKNLATAQQETVDLFRNVGTAQAEVAAAFAEIDKRRGQVSDPGNPAAATVAGSTSGGDPEEIQKISEARARMLKARAQTELGIERARIAALDAENKRAYDLGLIDAEAYFERRKALLEQSYRAEIAALAHEADGIKAKSTGDAADEIRKAQDLATIEGRRQELRIKYESDLEALVADRQDAERQHARDQIDLERRLAEMEGDRHKAAMLALDDEIAQLDLLMRKQGMADAERQARLAKVRDKGEARIGYDQTSEAAGRELADLDTQKRLIQAQADSGQISQIEAQGRIIQLERDRLPILQALGAQLAANARLSGDANLIQAAEDYNAAVAEITAGTSTAINIVGELEDQLASSARGALEDFFSSAISGAQSFGEAWKGLGKAFVNIIKQMLAKLIAFYLMLLILRAVNPSAADALEKEGPFGKGGKGFARGGYTGDGGVADVAGVVHGREFVVNARETARWRPLLEAINSGALRGAALPPVKGPGYMSGGYVAPADPGAGSAGGVEVNIINNSGQPVTTRERNGDDGKRIMDVVIGEAAADVRRGGPLAQAMQSTFGLQRRGVGRA